MFIRAIPGFPGYHATRDGRIWSEKSWKFLKPFLDKNKNWKIKTRCNGKQHMRTIGRLVLLAFVEHPFSGEMECCHGPRGRNCHELSNLEWGTSNKNNGPDKKRDGTSTDNRGEKNGKSKLTEQDVRSIRVKYTAANCTQQQLGNEYGISSQQISSIVNKKSWSHI